eukprot:1959982-Rhodomonas_salina.1
MKRGIALGAAPPKLGASLPMPTGSSGQTSFPGGFDAGTTVFRTDAPEKLDNGAIRVSSLEQVKCLCGVEGSKMFIADKAREQAIKVLNDNKDKILIARR